MPNLDMPNLGMPNLGMIDSTLFAFIVFLILTRI